MKFKVFIYHLLVAIALIVLMGAGGYLSLKQILFGQAEERLKGRAQFLASQLEDASNAGREEDILSRYGSSETGYSWIIRGNGEYVAYPSLQGSLDFKDRDRREVNPRATKDENPSFIAGNGVERRLIYSERLKNGNILVASRGVVEPDAILAEYFRTSLYMGIGLLFAALYLTMFLSHETLKPLFALQDYARNLAIGEYIDRAVSLREPDVVAIASILERFYIWARQDNALDQNPMSGLPGNKSFYDALFRLIETHEPLAVGFVDANDFTAYNNKYGYEKGDSVIRFMGVVILNAIKEKGRTEDRIFHLGGDRFIFTSEPKLVKDICEKIIADYDDQIAYYYDEQARQRGYIISNDKNKIAGKFAFMPICIGVATNANRPLSHPLQIGHIVGQIRNFLRNRQKSDFLMDRRLTDREEEYTGKMAPFSKEDLEKVIKQIREDAERDAAGEKTGSESKEQAAKVQEPGPKDQAANEQAAKVESPNLGKPAETVVNGHARSSSANEQVAKVEMTGDQEQAAGEKAVVTSVAQKPESTGSKEEKESKEAKETKGSLSENKDLAIGEEKAATSKAVESESTVSAEVKPPAKGVTPGEEPSRDDKAAIVKEQAAPPQALEPGSKAAAEAPSQAKEVALKEELSKDRSDEKAPGKEEAGFSQSGKPESGEIKEAPAQPQEPVPKEDTSRKTIQAPWEKKAIVSQSQEPGSKEVVDGEKELAPEGEKVAVSEADEPAPEKLEEKTGQEFGNGKQ